MTTIDAALCDQNDREVKQKDLRAKYSALEKEYSVISFSCIRCLKHGKHTVLIACACKEGVHYVREEPYFRTDKDQKHHEKCPYSQSSAKNVTHNELEQAGLDSNKCNEVLKRVLQAGFQYNPIDYQQHKNEMKYMLNQLVKSCREHNNKASSKKTNLLENIIKQKEITSFMVMCKMHYNLMRNFIINYNKYIKYFDENIRDYIVDIKEESNIKNFSVVGYSDIEYLDYFKTVKEIITIKKPLDNSFIAFGSIYKRQYKTKEDDLLFYFNDKYNGNDMSICIKKEDIEHLKHKKTIMDRFNNIENLSNPVIIYFANYKDIEPPENKENELRIIANPKYIWIADRTDFC